MKSTRIILSCEHAVDTIPAPYQHLFRAHDEVMRTHRAIDFGALEMAQHMQTNFDCACITATASRLLIDCNRSLSHRAFSEFTRPLPLSEKRNIINAHYLPLREAVRQEIDNLVQQDIQVLHISVHSFTPELNGQVRNAGIGILYDPRRHAEKEVAREWQGILAQQTPSYRVRLNYPYRGDSDGHTTFLRKKYTEADYLGLEIEINQALVADAIAFEEIKLQLVQSLNELLLLIN